MILLKANSELQQTFERLIQTMKVPVEWNGIFAVVDNYIILQGEVRSLFFHFDTRKVSTNLIDIPVEEQQLRSVTGNIRVQNAINMILYAFGKWGTIKGLRVDKDSAELNKLFAGIMKEYGVEPEYTPLYLRFYRNGMRITYEDVIQLALEYQNEQEQAQEEAGHGLWRRIIWKKKQADFAKVETSVDERKSGRLGNNFYLVGYLCPVCGNKLHMVVYPHGKEFVIETEEGGVILARAATCAVCHSFYTPRPQKLLAEGDVYTMEFGEDTAAYEDYMELLGRNGDRVSNYHCNEYADGRKFTADAQGEQDEETLAELCSHLPELSEQELRKIEARIEEGFYSDESTRQYEKHIRSQRKSRVTGVEKVPDERTDKMADEMRGRIAKQGRKAGRSSDMSGRVRREAALNKADAYAGRMPTGKSPDDAKLGNAGKADAVSIDPHQEAEREEKRAENSRNGAGIAQDIIVTPEEREAVRGKYEARVGVLERYSERQLQELKRQLELEPKLTLQEREEYIRKVEERLIGLRLARMTERVNACEGKNYAVMKRVMEELEAEPLSTAEGQSLFDKLKEWKAEQAKREVEGLIQKMPATLDRTQYQTYLQRIRSYEEADLSPYEDMLRARRETAEKQEIANVVKRARKVSREDLTALKEKLTAGDFLPELTQPYLEKLDDKIRQMDAAEMERICPNPMQTTFEEGEKAYERIEAGDFLPELKADALKMLSKRLAKLKTDECELLVNKLRDALSEAGITENQRHHFYPARRVLLHQTEPGETDVIEYAMASYAAGRGLFEYPVLVVDTTRSGTGKEGMILTPDHLYYSTMLTAYGIPVSAIGSIQASTGLLNRGLYVQQKNGEKLKIPYAVETKELLVYADVLETFVRYLQEKPDSRKLTYLAKEKHTTICCFRCGYQYQGGDTCPKCGYQNNG